MAITICKTENGWVEGLPHTGADYTEFRGIPYAKPPVGERRFAPPELPEDWDGIRPCKTWAKIAPQTFFGGSAEIYPYGKAECDEDCLYLNVYTPVHSSDERLPVFAWYHDGGLTNGWSYDPRNDPAEFVKKGIVVVPVGHRLGELGYMALPQLTAESQNMKIHDVREEDTHFWYGTSRGEERVTDFASHTKGEPVQGHSGNYGVMDTILSIEWVHRNIAYFGGDPENVTIGGESGGTTKCCALVAIPRVKGLFRRVFNQSGLAWRYRLDSQEEAEARGLDYLRKVGIDPDISLEELRGMDIAKLHSDMDPHSLPARLTKDGCLFCEEFPEAFLNNIEGIDFLNCICSGEADPGCAPELLDEDRRFHTKEAFYTHFRSLLGGLYDKYEFEQLVQVTDENAWKTAVLLAAKGLAPDKKSNYCRNLMVDRIFSAAVAEKYPENKVYTMRFSQVQPDRTDIAAPPEVAAAHGSDLWYSFRALERGIPASRPWREEDAQVGRWLNDYLANFIKTGDPNGEGLPKWPEGGEDLAWLDLNIQPSVHTGLAGKLDALLMEYAASCYSIELPESLSER